MGKMLSLVMLSAVQEMQRVPRPQQCGLYARVIRPVKESAATRTGTVTGTIGTASVKWAFSAAVVVFLREAREAQPSIRRLECKDGQDTEQPSLTFETPA